MENMPTTSDVRRQFSWDSFEDQFDERYALEFDRWLASVQAEAWDAAIYHLEGHVSPVLKRAAMSDNPYRKDV